MEDFNSKYTGEEVESLLDIVNEGCETSEEEIAAMGFTKNIGTITAVMMNGVSKGASGVVDLGTVITEHQDISGKVDKVKDKGLSTEDFTTALKNKLEGLTNYDDTTISNAVSSLQTQINTLVSGNANDAINSFNEIIAFLIGIKDSQDLSSIIASIEQQIANKIDSSVLAKVATSGSYNDLSNKPTIPSAVTETTVGGWGFTKNIGTVTGVKVNGSTKSPSSGTVDIGNVVTSVTINGISKTPSNGVVDLGTVGGGSSDSKSVIDTPVSATQTTPKMLIALTKYSSLAPEGFAEGSFFTIDFTSKSISASTAGYPYYINVGGTHYKCVTSAGVEMTKNNYATLTGYYTFMRVGTNFVLVTNSPIVIGGSGGSGGAYPQLNHGTSDTTFTLTPNTFHVWDEVSSLTLTLGAEQTGVANEYLFQFVSGLMSTSLSMPEGIFWGNVDDPKILPNKKYQVSILDGMAIICECDSRGLSTEPV